MRGAERAGSGAVWKGSEPNARLLRRKKRDASRGSARSFAAPRTLVQDDNQTAPPPYAGGRWWSRPFSKKLKRTPQGRPFNRSLMTFQAAAECIMPALRLAAVMMPHVSLDGQMSAAPAFRASV